MIVGVIGAGPTGADLAYGFVSALGKGAGGKLYLHDPGKEALDAGIARIRGHLDKALSGGKLTPKAAATIEKGLVPTSVLEDLADCDYVLEAATEDLTRKKAILAALEKVVRPDCLIGSATAGLPRARIAADAAHPERCFVNHPFPPVWRSTPVELVPSQDAALSARMEATLKRLGKVPIRTADVPCFAANDLFCTCCAEACRIVEEGLATPAQVDAIVNAAVGGGGPLNTLDQMQGNRLVVHCLELMRDAPGGSPWFDPPAILARAGDSSWHDRARPGDPRHSPELATEVRERVLAVLLGRSAAIMEQGRCDPTDFNWLTRHALGFKPGLLELAESLGAEELHRICAAYASRHVGFTLPTSIVEKRLPRFRRAVKVAREGELATVTVFRPEVKNALSRLVLSELRAVFEELAADERVRGIVLTSFDGSLAGADINELAALPTAEACEALSLNGQAVTNLIAGLGKPVVAALDGPVMGGGAELAMGCHGRVVGPSLMLAQPEVNLGVIPGYGGTQRLPRLVGLERGLDLLRTGRVIGAQEACAWGWATPATGELTESARAVLRDHLSGTQRLAPVDPAPMTVPDALPSVDIGHHSRAIDAILVEVCREGLKKPLAEGLKVEAAGFAACKRTADMDIGMKNFLENGPRVQASFKHA